MTLDVRRYRFGYAIFDGATLVSGEIRDRYIALEQLDRLAAKAKAKPLMKIRPCMCCRGVFESAGPHQRLCQTCRQSAGSLDLQMVG